MSRNPYLLPSILLKTRGLRILLVFLSVTLSTAVFSQGRVYQKVTESNARNARVSATDLFSAEQKSARRQPNDSIQYLSVNGKSLENIAQNRPSYLKFDIPFKDREFSLELIPFEIYGENFQVKDARGRAVNVKRGLHYVGIVNGKRNTLAAFSITDEGIRGFVSQPEGNFELGRDTETEEYVLYDTRIIQRPFECGVKDDHLPTAFNKDDFRTDFYATAADYVSCKPVEIYMEADYSIFQRKGSIQGASDYVVDVFSQVAALYENEGIQIIISEIKVWDTNDPYGQRSTDDYLSKFIQAVGTSFKGDLAHALSARQLGGGVAELDKLCSKGRGISGQLALSHNGYTSYSWDVNVIAHEVGHNLGSRHTHSCVWPGGPIDGCASVEDGVCDRGPTPQNGGTIMSYCHQVEAVGINFALGFGDLPGTLIRNRVRICKGDPAEGCNSSPCYEGGLVLISQEEVDNFGNNYGHCTTIHGPMEIRGANITDLSPLSNITEVKGRVNISNTKLESLSGLSGLSKVGAFMIVENTSLQNLDGIPNLKEIDEYITIQRNPLLERIDGLAGVNIFNGYIMIGGNSKLASLNGLSGITKVNGLFNLESNPLLVNLQGLENLREITGDFYIYQNNLLLNFNGASNLHTVGAFRASYNRVLNSMSGLASLKDVNNGFSLYRNNTGSYSTFSLEGLSSIKNIKGDLYISENSGLTSLQGLNTLQTIEGELILANNIYLTSVDALNNINVSLLQGLDLQGNDRLNLCSPPDFICNYLNITPGKPHVIKLNGDCGTSTNVVLICKGCPPVVSMTFSSQKQIDDFASYAGCDIKLTSVTITGANIENLYGLSQIKEITGDLIIRSNPNLTSLAGLSGLEALGGELKIEYNSKITNLAGLTGLNGTLAGLTILGNNNLQNMTGMSAISGIGTGGLSLMNNPLLNDVSGFSSLTSIKGNLSISSNNSLTTLNGFNNLTEVLSGIYLASNDLLQNTDAFLGIKEVRAISVTSNKELTNIDGFANVERTIGTVNRIEIVSNPKLANLNGLAGMKSLNNGALFISGNPLLNTIAGVAAIDPSTITSITITDNSSLSVCHLGNICAFLDLQGKSRKISGNKEDCLNLDAVIAACSVPPAECPTGNLLFVTQTDITDFGLDFGHCKDLPGNVTISGTKIEDLSGLSHVESIGGNLIIDETYLENLSGLGKLKSVGGFFRMFKNYYLEDFTGAGSLETVGEYLSLQNNSDLVSTKGMSALKKIGGSFMVLSNSNLTKVDGFSVLAEIGGALSIESNTQLAEIGGLAALKKLGQKIDLRNNGLLNLDGLSGLEEFNGGEINLSGNKALESIEGLKNIPATKITLLTIRDNQGANGAFGLSICNLPNICTYLSGGRPRTISGNLGDCATEAAVKAACASEPAACPTGEIIFSTQAQIVNFGEVYGHCTTIEGDIGLTGDNITNLDGLAHIVSIKGSFVFSTGTGLKSAEGMEALKEVGRSLLFYNTTGMVSTKGLSGLESIGENLLVSGNTLLENMDGLSNVGTVGKAANFSFNKALKNVNGLSSLKSVGGFLQFEDNEQLDNIDGLSALQSVGDLVYISGNAQLKTINGLAALRSVASYITIKENPLLQNINGFMALSSVKGHISVRENPVLTSIGGFSALSSVDEYISIRDNAALVTIGGFSVLPTVGKYLFIAGNPVLKTISGFSALQGINEYLTVKDNPLLQDINGLKNLKSVGGALNLDNNDQLLNLDGLSGIQTVNGPLFVGFNDKLQNVDGLSGIKSLNGVLAIQANPLLTSIEGLANIDPETITTYEEYKGLYIVDNGALSICNLPNICAYLALPAADYPRTISGNLGACADEAAVKASCSAPAVTLTLGTGANPTSCGGTQGSIGFTTSLEAGNYTLTFKRGSKDTTAAVTVANGGFQLAGLGKGVYSGFSIGTVKAAGERTLTDPVGHTFAAGENINPTTCNAADGSIAFTTNLPAGSYV